MILLSNLEQPINAEHSISESAGANGKYEIIDGAH